MSKLEEAKRRYKKGDVVRCLADDKPEVFNHGIHIETDGKIWAYSDEDDGFLLYKEERGWAEIISRAEFTQDDIKSGMKIQYRNGDYRLVTEFNGNLFLSGYSAQLDLYEYENFSTNCEHFDIVKVIKPTASEHQMFDRLDEGEVVWKEELEKQEIPEYTVEELQDKLGIKFKIKAND